jgi:hypothetical protein
MTVTAIDTGNRIQITADWAAALGLRGQVTLERTANGILIRPGPRYTWDDIFAIKLTVRSAPPDVREDELELTGDDLLF